MENPIFHTQDLCLRTLDTNLICKKTCAEMRINMIRKIVHIDEEKCNGCGACANACHEDAIAMVMVKQDLLRMITVMVWGIVSLPVLWMLLR